MYLLIIDEVFISIWSVQYCRTQRDYIYIDMKLSDRIDRIWTDSMIN